MQDNLYHSMTKTFFTWENAIAFVEAMNDKYNQDEWETVTKEVKDQGQSVRVELIYRKRQTELDV